MIARKLNIIQIIMGIDNDAALEAIEMEALKISAQIMKMPNVFDAVKPLRSNVSLEEIMQEQNYHPISYEEFRAIADELEMEEPIEELLALLTK